MLFMTPTGGGEHFNTTRRSIWVSQIRGVVERFEWPRHELWDLQQLPLFLEELGLAQSRLGFELGDCMTLGMSVNDFLSLRSRLPKADFVDASPTLRRLLSIHTPLEIEWTRLACQAGVWIHNYLPEILRPGMSERQLVAQLTAAFISHYGEGYTYTGEGGWDVRNPQSDDSNLYHAALTDRLYRAGDLICRTLSGASYQGYGGDVDRLWYIGEPPAVVQHWYRTA